MPTFLSATLVIEGGNPFIFFRDTRSLLGLQDTSRMLVRDLGEQGLLQRLFRYCDPSAVGDDAALLAIAPAQALVVTTDLLIDGVHFSIGHANPRIHTTTPEDAGWRAAAANLSDLAAMGATPIGITVGLGVPGDLPVDCVEKLYAGMKACLDAHQTTIAGGDVCRSTITTVAITAFGHVDPDKAIRRSHAQIDDVIVATGIHGASRAGLELLMHRERTAPLAPSDRSILLQAHQRPKPRLDVVPLLHQASQDTGTAFRVAGMDSSDGLADAVLQICRASGVGAILDRETLPMPACFSHWLPSEQALEWTLYGGEDFELILCMPEAVAIALQALAPNVVIIGRIIAGTAVVVCDRTGEQPEITLSLEHGFQHF